MGGTKKKSLGVSKSHDAGPQAAEVKKTDTKDKKEKGGKGSQQKTKLSVVLNEGQGMKAVADLKAITPQALARNTGVKISVANAFIKSLETKGTVKHVGGYSGHKVYALMQETKPSGSANEENKVTQQVSVEGTPAEKTS